MDRQALLNRIDRAACLDILAGMARHKSYTETEGERTLVRHMVASMRGLGMEAEEAPVEGTRLNAIGRLPGAGGGRSLMFNGHLDTNPATEGWTVDPWGGLVDERFVYGIGVSNMKAGDAAYFMRRQARSIEAGVRLARRRGPERSSSASCRAASAPSALIEHGVRADCFVNAEPTDLGGAHPARRRHLFSASNCTA